MNAIIQTRMIDGVKIVCKGIDPERWFDSLLLSFHSKMNVRTGDILDEPIYAFHRGLRFIIAPSKLSENNGYAMNVRGSLATFYNNGQNNAFDFNIEMLKTTIDELKNEFGIDPETSQITAFEFGANIQPNQQVKNILKGLRAYQYDTFSGLKMDGVFNGYQIKRQNNTFKAYDKGLQTSTPEKNLLRLEYSFNFSKAFSKYGIVVLNDLLNTDKLNAIKSLLSSIWQNAIFYDTGMNWRLMNNKQREKMLYYLDAVNWTNFNRSQRQKAHTNFRQLHKEFCNSSTQLDVLNLLTQKLDELTAETATKKGCDLHDFSKPMESQNGTPKKIRFTSLNKAVNHIQNNHEKPTKKKGKELIEIFAEKPQKTKPKKCGVCKVDISRKHPTAKYCTKRCNNSYHAKKRKEQRQKVKIAETTQLKALTKNIDRTDLLLLVEYRDNGNLYADYLRQNEINAPNYWSWKVTKVTVINTQPIVLTSYRAKQLIKAISNQIPQ